MIAAKPAYAPRRKLGRPPKEHPRKKRELWMTDLEWSDIMARCEQLGTKPGETVGILASFK